MLADSPPHGTRFAFSADGTLIRANQGHSVDVPIAFEALPPPELLFHGTATRFLDSIRGSRQHVHLSPDADTARRVGARHGRPVVLAVRSGPMARDGFAFFRSANGVWLTAQVPPAYLGFPE